jgi:hypothetical protein
MPLWSDQSAAMLAQCIATFGITVQYQRGTLPCFSVTGIFGHPNQEETEVQAQSITLDVQVSDFIGTSADPEPVSGDVFTLGRNIYTIYQVQVDSEGAAKLYATRTAMLP